MPYERATGEHKTPAASDREDALRHRLDPLDPRQVAVWSAMEPADRLDIAFQAYQFALDALRTRERERHPDLEPQELAWHVTRRMQRDPTLGT